MNVLNNEDFVNLGWVSGAGITYDATERYFSFNLLIIKNKSKIFNIV